jgi:hypothetical protein
MPAEISPVRVAPDICLVTHWHEDHLDAPTVRRYAQVPDVVFAGPESCVVRAQVWCLPAERTVILERGDAHCCGDIEVTALGRRACIAARLFASAPAHCSFPTPRLLASSPRLDTPSAPCYKVPSPARADSAMTNQRSASRLAKETA